jgi:hypothetical protein
MTDTSKRQFFRKGFTHHFGRCLRGFEEGIDTVRQADDFENFFESDESSYALTLAYPDEILLETAKNCGIDTENRSKREIVRELMLKREDY